MPTLSNAADASATTPRRGGCYHETVAFEVEGSVHRILRHGLEKHSTVFRDMFSLPQDQGAKKEGESDENPIKLAGCASEEFESLAEVLYPVLGETPELTKAQWTGVLKLSRLWDMPLVAKIAIEKLSGFELSAVEKIKRGEGAWGSCMAKRGIYCHSQRFLQDFPHRDYEPRVRYRHPDPLGKKRTFWAHTRDNADERVLD
ncbi:hypothetical protein NMY22_g13256 [Coprinellus aureogranulatus]|nr:hypothetical protein NMY22_g13256 [Coprinellus aureogranulatus]